MFIAKEFNGHNWCLLDAMTGILLYEGWTWEQVLQFAVEHNLPCREYDRVYDEVILY